MNEGTMLLGARLQVRDTVVNALQAVIDAHRVQGFTQLDQLHARNHWIGHEFHMGRPGSESSVRGPLGRLQRLWGRTAEPFVTVAAAVAELPDGQSAILLRAWTDATDAPMLTRAGQLRANAAQVLKSHYERGHALVGAEVSERPWATEAIEFAS